MDGSKLRHVVENTLRKTLNHLKNEAPDLQDGTNPQGGRCRARSRGPAGGPGTAARRLAREPRSAPLRSAASASAGSVCEGRLCGLF